MRVRYATLSTIAALVLSCGASAAPFVDDLEAYAPGALGGGNWDISAGGQYLQVAEGIGWNGSKGVTGVMGSDTWMFRTFEPPTLEPGEWIEFSGKLKVGGDTQTQMIAGFQFGGSAGPDRYYSDFRVYPTGSGWHWSSEDVPTAVGPGANVWIEYRSTLTPEAGGFLHHDEYRVYNEGTDQWSGWTSVASTTSPVNFNQTRLYINISNNDVSAVDDISFAVVPEPASMALIGFASMLMLRRR